MTNDAYITSVATSETAIELQDELFRHYGQRVRISEIDRRYALPYILYAETADRQTIKLLQCYTDAWRAAKAKYSQSRP